jgi:hypothetical protein
MTVLQALVALGFVVSSLTLPAPTPAQASSFSSATQATPASGIMTLAPGLAYSSTVIGGQTYAIFAGDLGVEYQESMDDLSVTGWSFRSWVVQ